MCGSSRRRCRACSRCVRRMASAAGRQLGTLSLLPHRAASADDRPSSSRCFRSWRGSCCSCTASRSAITGPTSANFAFVHRGSRRCRGARHRRPSASSRSAIHGRLARRGFIWRRGAGPFQYSLLRYFTLTALGIGRLANLAIALPIAYAGLTRYWSALAAAPFGIVTLGQRSLGAFVLHACTAC